MSWALIYAIAWWVVVAFAVVVLPLLLSDRSRGTRQYRGRRRA